MRKRIATLLLAAFSLTGCLKDKFIALNFLSLSLDVDLKEGGYVGQIDTVVLIGKTSQWEEGEVRQHGFVLSSAQAEPRLGKNDAIYAWPQLDRDKPIFQKTLHRNALPEAIYYIRAYAVYLLAGEERTVYSETDTLNLNLQVFIRGIHPLCEQGLARVEAVFTNRALNETYRNYGVVFSENPQEFPALPDSSLRITNGFPDPFEFSAFLSGLEPGRVYFARAVVQRADESFLYSNIFSFQIEFNDSNGDGINDNCDEDDDGDGVPDLEDPEPYNRFICGRDDDFDGCDDCAGSGFVDPNNDGIDTDGDGLCDAGDPDDDNDRVLDPDDIAPTYKFICGKDDDHDGCDDCSGSGYYDPAHDAPDTDQDGICDAGDNCRTVPNATQEDTDGDGLGDACDFDDDNDGVNDDADPEPLNPFVCGQDADGDGCDDCSIGVDGFGPAPDATPANDGC
ncbi:MAG: thrombospondin type 3 repeat-containing protein [Phaeodactylibacter sp.]|nr:thrombospondin type 3 repeat-containing protein [Phaeodactylibacter sp.]MCB9303820.1 thrombospondin type 3 repeat-containing protein [Lewinellaceae bacterium]